MPWPRGKVLGGSSSINGLIYIRGQKQDFDLWRQLGNTGWSYDDVLPYFRRAEHQERGADEHHGAGGPLGVSDLRAGHELHDAFIAGAQEAGYPLQPGFQRRRAGGRRAVAGDGPQHAALQRCGGYLRPAMRRPNLRVEIRALAHRVLFEGKRAVGVEYQPGRRGARRCARGARYCCAGGSINSPQLLQLSGVGPGELLQEHGIAVVHDLPGVGENLQDHIGARVVYRARRANTLNEVSQSWLRQAHAGLSVRAGAPRRIDDGSGADRAVCATRPGLDSPDVQYQFLAGSFVRPGRRCTISRLHGGLHSVPAGKPRLAADPLARSRNAAGDPAQLPVDAGRQGHLGRRAQDRARHLPDRGDAEMRLRGILAGPAARRATKIPRPYPPDRRHHLPPDQHLHDGPRTNGGGRHRAAGAGRRGAAGDRRLDHADGRLRQHQRGDDHDRREGRRHDPARGSGDVQRLPIRVRCRECFLR